MKAVLVCGAGGFIGSHLVKRLKKEGYYVVGVDLKYPEFSDTEADRFLLRDLRLKSSVDSCFQLEDIYIAEVYQLAADMGGAGYIFSGENDADIMQNSAMINLNIVQACVVNKVSKVFFSSSACIYPERNQLDPNNPNCSEDTAYPAAPDSEYGWEKIFAERMYLAYQKNYGLDVRIARFHNIFGPEGSWNNGKEKAPAALCRKIAEAKGSIEIWGDGKQTRSFLYIDECLEGIRRLMEHPVSLEPLNIGSDEMVTINELAKMIAEVADKDPLVNHIEGPLGVRGRCSDNKLIQEKLGWSPDYKLQDGLKLTYNWIEKQVNGK